MDLVLIFGYIVFCIICFGAYALGNWFTGNDTTFADITAMAFVSIIPVLNLIFLFESIIDILEELPKNSATARILIKGRSK